MTCVLQQLGSVFAAAQTEKALKALEYDLPAQPWEWLVYGGGFLLAFVAAVFLSLRDTRSLALSWRIWLTTLRLTVLAAIVVIAINPQERTQKISFRPSRVALLVDTSLSMRFPEEMPPTGTDAIETVAERRRHEAVAELLSKSSLLESLREQHEVSIFPFDSKLGGPLHVFRAANDPAAATDESQEESTPQDPLDWAKLLEPQGLETRLGESLLDAIRQLSGRTLAGIVVITDGGSNAGVEPATAHDVAKAAGLRLITVGVGSTQQPVNLQVASIQAPTDVHLGDAFELSAFIQGQGLAGTAATVELLMKPEDEDVEPTVVETRDVTLHEDGLPVEVKFQRTPSIAGGVEFFIRTRPKSLARELTEEDNQRRKTVNIIDRKTRVLLIAGGPMRDYQFVRNMLFRHDAILVDVWLQTVVSASAGIVSQESDTLLIDFPQTAAELFEYDVVVAFDPNWKEIPAEQLQLLREWVSTHAGGLILVAGDVYTPTLASATEELQPVRELYPVFLTSYLLDFQFDGSSDHAWPIAMTQEGENAGFLQLSDDAAVSADRWEEFRGIFRCYPSAGSKAGAVVYAHFSDPRAQTEYGQPILLASQFYGAGRTLYVGSAELWRIRALGDELYDRFWTKAIREVGQGRLNRGTSRGMLLLERNQYILGQTVRVRAQLLNAQLQQLEADSVSMDVFDPSGKPLVPSRKLLSDPNRPGQFAGDFRASAVGTYRLDISIPESRDQLKAKIDVVLPNLESDAPRQNAKLLTDLVRDTGGRYLRLDEAESRLPALLPSHSEEFLVDERLRTLWDRQWVLLLLVGLLSAEWLTRKLLRLA